MFVLITFALTWLTVSFGLLAKAPAGANSLSLILVVLPFTAVIEALRGLLMGTPMATARCSPSPGAPA